MPVTLESQSSSSCRQKRGLDEVIVRRYVDTLLVLCSVLNGRESKKKRKEKLMYVQRTVVSTRVVL